MIVLPLDEGAVHVMVALALLVIAVAATLVGVPGTVLGVTEFEAEEADELPFAFKALTVKVYVVPYERPVNEADVALDPAVTVLVTGRDVKV